MTVKLLTDNMDTTITDDDRIRIDRVLEFWFRDTTHSAPKIDSRMDIWFGSNDDFDREIRSEFAVDIEQASSGELAHWAREPRGRLALILLLDQFRRNVFRSSAKAFAMDNVALKLCVEGAMEKKDNGLTPIERVFFYMPLQHTESRKVQRKSVNIFNRLTEAVSPTLKETFETFAQFAELHADIIERFGRFPHRNSLLDRANTPEEEEYLSNDGPSFGQG